MIIVILTLILQANLITHAQTITENSHLTFKGIPIDGKLNEFVGKMTKSGFIHKGTKEGMAILEGEFATYRGSIVLVSTLTKRDLVNAVAVLFPEQSTWPALYSNYLELKNLLTEKYGPPARSVEEFQSYTPDDDGTKFIKVQLGACNYVTSFEADNGNIQLSIEHDGTTSCFVRLLYLDKQNSSETKKSALNDL